LSTQIAGAGEIRTFDLGDRLRVRLHDATRRWVAPRSAVAMRDTYLGLATQLVFFGTAGIVLAWILSDVIGGTTATAALVLALLVVSQLQSTSAELQSVIGQVATMSRAAARYRWLVTLGTDQRTHYSATGQVSTPLADGLALDHVDYTYPGAGSTALSDISLTITPGTTVAIVGENGAGKSTLVNVITGLARPSSGTIRVGGIDIDDLDLVHWREHLSGAFQDHVRFELTLGHAVGIGDLPQRENSNLVQAAIHQGTADHILSTAPDGLDTQLGPSWPNGMGLSGGQWQRVALARGMMRAAPVIRVLDEPTSALDAHTEHEIFERYAAAAATGRATGTITLLVTHRFSTGAAADRVIVMQDGHITEAGTHTELMAIGGHYAELYGIQAAGYR
jgi:ATP-binding cassette subfamily B protein